MALTKAELSYLLALQQKKGRQQHRRFLAEGVRLLEEALEANYRPQVVFYAPSEVGERGQKLIAEFIARGVETKSISVKECSRLADTESSQGMVAVIDQRQYDLAKQLEAGPRRVLVCDKIGDPGNLGTLIRSAAAFSFDLVITTEATAEVTNPKTIRATMGALFRMPIIAAVDDKTVIGRLKRFGYEVYAADVKGKYINRTLPISAKAALVIGSEAAGSGPTLVTTADYRIKIPMAPKTESLNAAVAGSILMFWFAAAERMHQ